MGNRGRCYFIFSSSTRISSSSFFFLAFFFFFNIFFSGVFFYFSGLSLFFWCVYVFWKYVCCLFLSKIIGMEKNEFWLVFKIKKSWSLFVQREKLKRSCLKFLGQQLFWFWKIIIIYILITKVVYFVSVSVRHKRISFVFKNLQKNFFLFFFADFFSHFFFFFFFF